MWRFAQGVQGRRASHCEVSGRETIVSILQDALCNIMAYLGLFRPTILASSGDLGTLCWIGRWMWWLAPLVVVIGYQVSPGARSERIH